MSRAAVLLAALALTFYCVLAQPATSGLDDLMQRLSQVKSAKAKFVERKYLRVLTSPLELTGTLSYSAPSHLEKHTLTPKPESLVLDRDRLTVEDARKKRRTLALQEYPALWAFVESIRSTLAGDLQTLNRFYRIDFEGDESDWRLVLRPRDPKVQSLVSDIRIAGSHDAIRTIEVLETGGDRSVMTVTEDAR